MLELAVFPFEKTKIYVNVLGANNNNYTRTRDKSVSTAKVKGHHSLKSRQFTAISTNIMSTT